MRETEGHHKKSRRDDATWVSEVGSVLGGKGFGCEGGGEGISGR